MPQLHPISAPATCANPHRPADVLFLHGLGGHHLTTWQSSPANAQASFPHWLAADFPQIAVWSLAYAASPSKLPRFNPFSKNPDAGHAMSLPDRARQVLDLLPLHHIGTRPLFFICHSLGGLLAKQILRTSADAAPTSPLHNVFTNTRAVLFLATPHTGSALASLADNFRTIFATTINLTELQAHDAHLRDLYNWYRNHALAPNIETATYFENYSIKGFKIVDPSSANPGTGRDPIGLDDNHISIAKPANQGAQLYLAASAILRDHVLVQPKPIVQLPTSDQPPFELPPPADQFVGRIPQLEDLTARLRARKNTAVVGAAGMGKTALSAQALRSVIGDSPASLATSPFPDGLIFVDLYTNATATLNALWDILANKLASPTFLERSPSLDRATAACQAAQQVLIVIEGGEEASGDEGRPTIHQFLSVLSPQNRWLLLTRLKNQALPTETIHLSDALEPSEAAQLFDHITRREVPAPLRTQALNLFAGHPLAITWAANLLAFKDDSPQRLVADWNSEQLPPLTDPLKSEHTLRWLFNRSVRGLNPTARRVLDTAGLLARKPFPLDAITAVLDDSVDSARQSIKSLAQRSLLMLADQANDLWQFTHVLAYHFARREKDSDPTLRLGLARWLEPHLREELKHSPTQSTLDALEHLSALLRADTNQSLWQPLTQPAIYEFSGRLADLGSLAQAKLLLDAVDRWLDLIPQAKAADSYWLRERSEVGNRQADVIQAQGNLRTALSVYQNSLDIRQKLAAADPSNSEWQRDLSVSHTKIGDVLRAQGDLTSALAAFQNSLDITQKLAAADPSNSQWQRDLSISHEKIGNVLQAQGDLTPALAAFQNSLDIRQKLAAADPSNSQWQRDLSISHNKIADVLLQQGDLTSALAAFQKDLDITQKLAAADPSNSQWQRDLHYTLGALARLYEKTGDTEQARQLAKKRLPIAERLAALDPTNATWQDDLKFSRALVARLGGTS